MPNLLEIQPFGMLLMYLEMGTEVQTYSELRIFTSSFFLSHFCLVMTETGESLKELAIIIKKELIIVHNIIDYIFRELLIYYNIKNNSVRSIYHHHEEASPSIQRNSS
jgi:hypothetical protein